MPATFTVPDTVLQSCRRVAALNRVSPMEGVVGKGIAERLMSEDVDISAAQAMHRYFTLNARTYQTVVVEGLRTEADSAVARSWAMYGGDAGAAWAADVVKTAIAEGLIIADPIDELFTLEPHEVYQRFSLSAWRFEYDLTPAKAARFLEHYSQATGNWLDTKQAFGDAASTVNAAIFERFGDKDPFAEVVRALTVEDDEYYAAATLDLAELTNSVDESLSWVRLANQPPLSIAKMVWAPFVAYFILAVEKPEALKAVNVGSLKPPSPATVGTAPRVTHPPTSYNDVINTYITFFHPSGKHYVNPAEDKQFAGIDMEVWSLLYKAYQGHTLQAPLVKKMLGRARRWCAQNKMAGSLFHVFNADWNKGNWQHILENIPKASDMWAPFETFAASKPLPAAGVKLQQTLSDTATKAKAFAAIDFILSKSPGTVYPAVKVSDTATGKALAAAGTPIGVYSLLSDTALKGENTYIVLGAFDNAGFDMLVVQWVSGTLHPKGTVVALYDQEKVGLVQHDELTVKMAHYDMPGTSYKKQMGLPAPPIPPKPDEPPVVTKKDATAALAAIKAELPEKSPQVDPPEAHDAAKEYLLSEFDVPATDLHLIVPWSKCATGLFLGKLLVENELKSGYTAIQGLILKNKKLGARFQIMAGYRIETTAKDDSGAEVDVEDTIIVVKVLNKEANSITHESDDDLVGAIKSGKIEVFHMGTKLWPAQPKTLEPPPITVKEGPTYKPWDPKYGIRDCIAIGGYPWQIIAILPDPDAAYVLSPLVILPTTDPSSPVPPTTMSGVVVDASAHPGPDKLDQFKGLLKPGVGMEFKNIPSGWFPNKHGAKFMHHGTSVTLWGAVQDTTGGNKLIPLVVVERTGPTGYAYLEPMALMDANLSHVFASSYVAPTPAEEIEAAAAPEKCGIKSAFDKAAKLGWAMATATELQGKQDKYALWPLGAVLAYGAGKQRIIIGYAFNAAGTPVYVIQTETGAVNFKTVAEGGNYGPLLTMDDAVIGALLPKAGAAAPKSAFPKLNYKLSDAAKAYATENSITFVPGPKGFPFKVGSTLAPKAEGKNALFLGWVQDGVSTAAALQHPSGSVSMHSPQDLVSDYELVYKYGTKVDPAGVVIFGKGAKDFLPTVGASPTVTLPCALPESWDVPQAVEQPPLPTTKNQGISAGIIGIVPAASPIGSSDSTFGLPDPAILMRHPLNEYEGYKLTFPKGRVEPGESLVIAAVRETKEETGLSMKPIAYLGDFSGKSTMTRFYLGTITGGNPKHADNETDAVTLRTLTGFSQLGPLSSPAALQTFLEALPWWGLLLPRDQAVMQALVPWLIKYGIPGHTAGADTAEFDAAPTSMADVTKVVTYDATLSVPVEKAYPKQGGSAVDYQVEHGLLEMADACGDDPAFAQWVLIPALPMINKGYPPPGCMARRELKDGTMSAPFVVKGYVYCAGVPEKPSMMFMVGQKVETKTWTPMLIAGTVDDAAKFFPVVQALAPNVGVAADPVIEEFWSNLYKKLPFPVTTAAVAQMRRAVADEKYKGINTVQGAKTVPGGPSYGEGFSYQGAKYLAMGHVKFSGPGVDIALQMAVDDEGEYKAFVSTDESLFEMKLDPATTDSYTIPDAWFTHPDPVINAKMQHIYANGGNLEALGLTIKTVKEKWLKEAGVPYYAVASYTILQDIAALFVPGAATKPEHDAVLGCLKKRMQLTQKGKKAAPANDIVSLTPAAKPTTATAAWHGEVIAALMMNPSEATWSAPGPGFSGGTKPNYIVTAMGGTQFVWKPTPSGEAPFRPHTDWAAYQIMVHLKGNNVPVGLLTLGGVVGSVQPVVTNNTVLKPTDYDAFTDADKTEILAQHVADMFVGDHDGHFGNWLRTPGGLVSIDHGQAFKFIIKNVQESLSPAWDAPGNFGIHVAKRLLMDWAHGKVTIPTAAFAAMKGVIDKIGALTPTKVGTILAAWAKGGNYEGPIVEKVAKTLMLRVENQPKQWTSVMKDLATMRAETFAWPAGVSSGASVALAKTWAPPKLPAMAPQAVPAPVAPPKPPKPKVVPKSLTGAAKDLAFTEREIEHIADASKAGYQGKAIQIDKGAFENQEVMVKRVKYNSAESPEQVATLIHFRIARPAALQAAKKLALKAKVVSPSMGGPAPLAVDNFWEALVAGVKTVNEHMGPNKKKDGTPNAGTIAKVTTIQPQLEAIISATKSAKGMYEGVPAGPVNQMATNYLIYANTILAAAAQAPKVFDAEIETFFQFLWQEPAATETDDDSTADIKVTKTVKAGFWPTSQASGGDVVIQGQDSPFYEPGGSKGSYKQSQFCVTIPSIPGARVYWNPSEGEQGYSEIRTHFGQGWGIIPGEPTEAKVATLLKAFQQATGLDTSVPSNDDEEVLYLAKQAYVMQGESTPTKDGAGLSDPGMKAVMASYSANHDAAAALPALRQHVANKLGTTPASLIKLPGYNPPPTYTRGAGFYCHQRLGWTRDKLAAFLGQDVYLAHHTTQEGVWGFLQKVVPKSGSLVANAVRTFYGIPLSGGSVSSDFVVGGSANIFACMRRAPGWCENHLYFDVSVFLRTDVYVVGSSDSYGNDTATRYLSPESWKSHGLSKTTGDVSTGSSWQFCVRHALDLRQYLARAIFPSKTECNAAIALCKQHGWLTFANGRKLEDVMTTG